MPDDEYYKRSMLNIQAVEKLIKRSLSEDEQFAVGVMVHRQMRAELIFKERLCLPPLQK